MQQNDELFLYGFIIFFIALFFIVAFYASVIRPFMNSRHYIKKELQRACGKEEYLYWKRELKKLYITLIPIFGRIIEKHMDK